VGLYIGWLEIRKDPQKAAGEARCLRPSAPIIHRNPPTIVMTPTTVGCCPGTDPARTELDLDTLSAELTVLNQTSVEHLWARTP
jgi:hypothetical protein